MYRTRMRRKLTVPIGAAKLPRPVAVTVTVNAVVLTLFPAVDSVPELAETVVELANGTIQVGLLQFLTRLVMLKLPNPTASLKPAL